jgi:hypothetical protein
MPITPAATGIPCADQALGCANLPSIHSSKQYPKTSGIEQRTEAPNAPAYQQE